MTSASGVYEVRYDPKALKELTKLDKPVARRIVGAVDRLKADPRPSGARPLVNYPDLWRLRVGDYRVIYTIRDAELLVLALRIAHRRGVYRSR
ncbi:MAG TPA: type II toxin-antitoxin system RelE/ParE family toxin [Candidatus Dormibacteraeota bacterium]|nr:type II toxin-antitoxin system RelE/ParE family toxin [Candidatus Dormibacteraeota bacterium]